jgi:hypothetical protein
MTLIDIGGGFPGSDDTKLKFEEVFFFFFKSPSSLWVIKDV